MTHVATDLFCLSLADDPDSVPMEWRAWLAGQQRLPPNQVPMSGANATLDRLEPMSEEEQQRLRDEADQGRLVAGAAAADLGETLAQNLQNSSTHGTVKQGGTTQGPASKKYQPESWRG